MDREQGAGGNGSAVIVTPSQPAHFNQSITEPRLLTESEFGERFLNVALVFVLLPPALMVLAVCYLLHRLLNRQAGSFLYAGERLGRGKREFRILKIRTLVEHAERQLGSALAREGSGLELRMGSFLRATRLDEIPQLFNVLRGDLNMIGPRPLRRTVYEKWRQVIPQIESQFRIKPGLIGPSQVLTPHSTTKRMRIMLDNRLLGQRSPRRDLAFIGWTIWLLLRNLVTHAARSTYEQAATLARTRHLQRRKLRRVSGRGVRAALASINWQKQPVRMPPEGQSLRVIDLNSQTLRVETGIELSDDREYALELVATGPGGGIKHALCHARLNRKVVCIEGQGAVGNYLMDYVPHSEFDHYLLDQYILHKSIAGF